MSFLIHIEYTLATKNNLQREALDYYKSFQGFTCENKDSFTELVSKVNTRLAKQHPRSSPLQLHPREHHRDDSGNPYYTIKPEGTNQSVVVFQLIPVKGKIEAAGIDGFPCVGQNVGNIQ